MQDTTVRSSDSYVATRAESTVSAVSWAAIIAGAFAASAVSLMLISAGTGMGFAAASPWEGSGPSATTIGIGAIVWLVITQIISAGLGGYIAGRLRTKWVNTHSDEVYFRDTAHGFLVWAVGAIVSAFLLTSAVSSIVSGTAKVGATAMSGAGEAVTAAISGAAGSTNGNPTDYIVDSMFRTDRPDPAANRADARAEVGRIISSSIAQGEVTPEDRTYVASVIAAQTGVDQAAAEQRVNDGIERATKAVEDAKRTAKEAADAARKAASAFAFWGFISLLIGAFSASFAATRGGRTRDRMD